MKKVFIFLLIPIYFGSCRIQEDLSDCFPDNEKVLYFVYYDKEGKEVFADHVQRADVYFYDASGNFIHSRHLTANDFMGFQGMRLDLEPGTYTAVFWGNVIEHNELTHARQMTTLDESFINFKDNTTSDKLFYAPKEAIFGNHELSHYTFSIPADVAFEKTVAFNPLYRTIYVFVRNYPEDYPLEVISEGLPAKHNFRVMDMDNTHEYRGYMRTDSSSEYQSYYLVNTGLFGYDTPATVTLRDPVKNGKVAGVKLAEFINRNDLDLENHHERDIHILFDFESVDVEVKIPDWDITETIPGLQND